MLARPKSETLKCRYPFAIVGINISQFAVQMLRTRQLQFYLFEHGTDKKTFNEFYCKYFMQRRSL